jgi:flagellar biogenesis protein FliO
MGLGREYREKILEEEHQKYFDEIAQKKKEEWLESEARFMELYSNRMTQDINVLLVAVCVILGFIFGLVWVIYQLFTAFS